MVITDDVLVIGGGIVAYTVALSAAGTDARMRLFVHKKSTLRQANGLVNVFGYVDGDGPLSDPYAGLDALPEGHPHRAVGKDDVHIGLRIFDEAVGDTYRGGRMDSNALMVTHGGAVKPIARYPVSIAPGLASSLGDTLLVGLAGLADFDALVAVGHLVTADVPFSARGVAVKSPERLRADAKVTRLAKVLDRDENVDDGTVRSVLIGTVAEELDGESCVGFPTMPGDNHDEDVHAEFFGRLDAPVSEIPTGPPSLLGFKFKDVLFDVLGEVGIHISAGNPAVDFETDTGRVKTVVTDQKSRSTPYSTDQAVPATGGFVGKGLDSDREPVTEPVLGCHVLHPGDRYDWSDPEVLGDYAFACSGVVPGGELRPTDEDGEPYFKNLHIAGDVIDGADVAHEKPTSGASLATGAVADRLASGKATG